MTKFEAAALRRKSRLTLLTSILATAALPPCVFGEIKLLTGDANGNVHQRDATLLDLSADGDLVLFTSGPPVTGSTPGITQGGLYVRKLSANSLTFVGDTSVPGPVDASFSNDGRYVTWHDTSANSLVYWRDVQTNTTRLITPSADGACRRPVISGDGRYVAYASIARNLVSNPAKLQAAGRAGVYLYDSTAQTTVVVSLASTGDALGTGIGAGSSVATSPNEFDFSNDGKFIVFSSDATNVHPDRKATYPAGFLCICRRNLTTGAVDLLNKTAAGALSDGNFSSPRLNTNGSRATFFGFFVGALGTMVKMIPSVNNPFGTDLYVKDAGTGEVWWASKTTDNSASDGAYGPNAISGDGQTVAFASSGTKLVTGNTDAGGGHNGSFDIFRADLGAAGAVTTTQITLSPNGSGNVDYRVGPLLPGTGDYVAFCTSQVQSMLGTGNNDSIYFHGFGVGTLPVPTGPSFSQWASTLPAGQRGYTDNPAGDGVPNLTKFVMGMNGNAPDVSRLPVREVKTGAELGLAGNTSRYLTLRVRILRNLPAGITWKVRAAGTLTGLGTDNGSAIQVGAPVADGDYDVFLFRHPQPLTGQGFMDVKITAQ